MIGIELATGIKGTDQFLTIYLSIHREFSSMEEFARPRQVRRCQIITEHPVTRITSVMPMEKLNLHDSMNGGRR
jgi:hypothetical protein